MSFAYSILIVDTTGAGTPAPRAAPAFLDAATLNPATGAVKAAFLPPSSIGGTVLDWLHPNRAGYQAMANSVPLRIFEPNPRGHR